MQVLRITIVKWLFFLGFQRVYYEKKQHFHGLVFRKLGENFDDLTPSHYIGWIGVNVKYDE